MLKEKIFRNSKNSIFLDLFSIPEYLLQLVETLHPEMTDLKEDEVEILTLQSVFMVSSYNDLGVLVRNKLLILAEAQSTWSINILIRILLYLASTYHDYIYDKNNSNELYQSKKVEIPEPEFYVIYTGDRKIDRDFISLKEDIFENPNAKLDLTARVIQAENKEDIVGQYIIFCHVFDSQRKIYGYTKQAIENTIKICQNLGVLKEYLEKRKKEVEDIMVFLFDQEHITEAYAQEKAIFNVIATYKEVDKSVKETINRIAERFSITKERAERYVNDFWNGKQED